MNCELARGWSPVDTSHYKCRNDTNNINQQPLGPKGGKSLHYLFKERWWQIKTKFCLCNTYLIMLRYRVRWGSIQLRKKNQATKISVTALTLELRKKGQNIRQKTMWDESSKDSKVTEGGLNSYLLGIFFNWRDAVVHIFLLFGFFVMLWSDH